MLTFCCVFQVWKWITGNVQPSLVALAPDSSSASGTMSFEMACYHDLPDQLSDCGESWQGKQTRATQTTPHEPVDNTFPLVICI